VSPDRRYALTPQPPCVGQASGRLDTEEERRAAAQSGRHGTVSSANRCGVTPLEIAGHETLCVSHRAPFMGGYWKAHCWHLCRGLRARGHDV